MYTVAVGNGSHLVGVIWVLVKYNAPECELDATGAWGGHPANENPRMVEEIEVWGFAGKVGNVGS